jgi:RHS repeat-associated protein
MAGISSRAAGKMQNKEKTFQGQQFDDDLGINLVQFKWRNHDPQIGRFIEIDPLADKYVYNSTYAFSENKVIGDVELEGLESVNIALMNSNFAQARDAKAKEQATQAAQRLKDDQKQKSLEKLAENVKAATDFLILVTAAYEMPLAAEEGSGSTISSETRAVFAETKAVVSTVESQVPTVSKATTLYRAASSAEVVDAAANGVRVKSGGYETGKLFATSAEDAAQFGKNNYGLDGIPNTVTKVNVPNSVMKTATTFTADGMKAVAIPANQLQKLPPLQPLNYSPKPTNPYMIPGFW